MLAETDGEVADRWHCWPREKESRFVISGVDPEVVPTSFTEFATPSEVQVPASPGSSRPGKDC